MIKLSLKVVKYENQKGDSATVDAAAENEDSGSD